jgi:hypothetical protein
VATAARSVSRRRHHLLVVLVVSSSAGHRSAVNAGPGAASAYGSSPDHVFVRAVSAVPPEARSKPRIPPPRSIPGRSLRGRTTWRFVIGCTGREAAGNRVYCFWTGANASMPSLNLYRFGYRHKNYSVYVLRKRKRREIDRALLDEVFCHGRADLDPTVRGQTHPQLESDSQAKNATEKTTHHNTKNKKKTTRIILFVIVIGRFAGS